MRTEMLQSNKGGSYKKKTKLVQMMGGEDEAELAN